MKSVLERALQYAPVSDTDAQSDFWAKSIGSQQNVELRYIHFSTHVPVNDRVIFYECMSGARVGDNPLAIFEHLLGLSEYKDFLHVWSLEAAATIPAQYRALPNVVFVRRSSMSYVYFLASAGYIICNANLPPFFTRRSEQRYLNTWHGVPYKALGRDTPKARFGVPASTATFLKATHVLSTCEFMTDAVMSAYSMCGTSSAKIAETGYPRVDLTVNYSPDQRVDLRRRLGLVNAESEAPRPVVLYAPTWRAESGQDVVDTDQLLQDINALSSLDADIVYRGHHRMNRILEDQSVGNEIRQVIIPDHEISSNELLAIVDILITDYSSIYFDFVPTGRPIIHYLYDLDEYQRTRGLNLGLDDLPGVVARSTDELLAAVKDTSTLLQTVVREVDTQSNPVQGEPYKRAQQRFCPHEDGRASERAVDFFFNDMSASFPVRTAIDSRPTEVYWAGTSDDAASLDPFLHKTIKAAQSRKMQTALVIGREAALKKSTLKEIKAVSSHLATISYTPADIVLLPEEQAAYETYTTQQGLTLSQVRKILKKEPVLRAALTRNYRRRMDDTQFDRVIHATGLTNHELAMAVLAERDGLLLRAEVRRRMASVLDVLRSGASKALPKGSRRHRYARGVYRRARRGTKWLRSKLPK